MLRAEGAVGVVEFVEEVPVAPTILTFVNSLQLLKKAKNMIKLMLIM